MKKLFPWIALALILLSSCMSLSEQERYEAMTFATAYAKDPNFIPPPHYQTLAATGLNLYFPTATPTPNPNWTPTMSFYEFSGTQVAQQQNISMTNQAQQLQMERERLAAEAAAQRAATQAYYAQVTAEAYRIEVTAQAQATFMQATANAQGTQMMNTAQAAATATTDMQIRIDATANAANAATAAVQPTHAVWTQNAVYVIQTVEQGNAEKVALAVKRQETKNILDALLPWTLVVIAVYVLGKGLFKWLRQRVHQRDEFGRPPLLTIEDDAGNTNIVKSEILPKAITSISATGVVKAYELTSNEEQADINRRNQAVDALAVLPTPYAQQGTKIMNAEFGRSTPPRVNIGKTNTPDMRAVLDEVDSKLIEEE